MGQNKNGNVKIPRARAIPKDSNGKFELLNIPMGYLSQ
jgi:hypothetical protein